MANAAELTASRRLNQRGNVKHRVFTKPDIHVRFWAFTVQRFDQRILVVSLVDGTQADSTPSMSSMLELGVVKRQ